MRACRLLMPLVLFGSAWIVPNAARAVPSCSAIVAPGGDIQTALDSLPRRATICIPGGTYTLSASLVPKAGQTIVGLKGGRVPLIACQAVVFCVDGSAGPARVTLKRLVFKGAKNVDIRTGDRWRLRHVEARGAFEVGIVVRGDGVVIRGSFAHDNGQFGLRAVNATDVMVANSEFSFNATAPDVDPGFTGGVKFNGVIGLVAKRNRVHDNGGGGRLWIDIDSQQFRVVDNRLAHNEREQIRIETSCYGLVRGNKVKGGGIASIDVFNAHDVTVASNAVTAAAATQFGIRMLNNGRTSTVGTGACRIGGVYQNVNNVATANTIVLQDVVTVVGIDSNGGIAANNAWSGNRYRVPDCAGLHWQWWDGVAELLVDFAAWQAFGQDVAGACTAAA